MPTINDTLSKYRNKIDPLDIELLIAAVINRPREFVLAHPEYDLTKSQKLKAKSLLRCRLQGKPLAYILSKKEFFGLDFKVNQHTLIPRPETELLVEKVLKLNLENKTIVDVGTGSGNIIISLVKNIRKKNKFIAIDISTETLHVAKQNAKMHKVDKKIKFLKGTLLEPILKSKNYKLKTKNLVVVANLPYLSKKIYSSASKDIKKYEPSSALLSGNNGLSHYKKLLRQIKKLLLFIDYCSLIIEISPEQKNPLQKLLKRDFPGAKTSFYKDLSGRWRLAQIEL